MNNLLVPKNIRIGVFRNMKKRIVTLFSTYGLNFFILPLILNHDYPLPNKKQHTMHTLHLTITLILFSTFALGQQISRNTLTTAGDFSKNENGISVSWTMGNTFCQTPN